MSGATYRQSLAFLKRSGITQVRLMGGEPTFHPDFCSFVHEAIAQKMAITIFTGGLIPPLIEEFLVACPADSVSILLNFALSPKDSPTLRERQEQLCLRLGPRLALGVNLCHADHDLTGILSLITMFGLRRRVRLGLAHPIAGGGNLYLRWPHAKPLGAQVEQFLRLAESEDVTIDLDCGWTPCLFSPDFSTEFSTVAHDAGNRCNPLVDILPNGDIISCYALSRMFRRRLTEDDDREHVTTGWLEQQNGLRRLGSRTECVSCAHFADGTCNGGCLARTVNRVRNSRGEAGKLL